MRVFSLRIICLLLVAAGSSLVSAGQKPNILFIAIDDLNDWVGCLGGHPQAKTPNIDALAARGVNFTNAHCQAPICNCSRVSMLLGKLPSTTGMYFLAPDFRKADRTKDEETVFQFFRRHGYYASTRGKVFHGQDPASFDHIEPVSGWRQDKTRLAKKWRKANALWDWGQVNIPDEEQVDYKTAQWAADKLPTLASQEKPFFLAVGFSLPHVPIYASKKWCDLHPLDGIQLPATLATDRDDLSEYSRQLTINPTAPRQEWMVENDEWKPAVQAYLASSSFVDSLIGTMLDSLHKSGAADRTIVVLWSDHGFHLGEKLRWAKRSLWEESTRVPLIFAGPGIPGGTCSRAVGLIDVFPTLAEHCGLPDKSDLEGRSLSPLLKDPTQRWERPALTTFGPNNHAVRTDHWRYIRYSDGSEELYDHRTDPDEWNNVASDPQHVALIASLKAWLPTTNVPPLPGSRGADSPLYSDSRQGREK
ncbi:MAG: sulfatase [Planctomycetaceae bacterium]|nr:sulfatase [Planctomycetaceae bacterium]